jgi:hypothetical protein
MVACPRNQKRARQLKELAGFFMSNFARAGSKPANSENASEYQAFQPSVIVCRLFHVTCMAHGKRRSVREAFVHQEMIGAGVFIACR